MSKMLPIATVADLPYPLLTHDCDHPIPPEPEKSRDLVGEALNDVAVTETMWYTIAILYPTPERSLSN